jgi:hypothetical protein
MVSWCCHSFCTFAVHLHMCRIHRRFALKRNLLFTLCKYAAALYVLKAPMICMPPKCTKTRDLAPSFIQLSRGSSLPWQSKQILSAQYRIMTAAYTRQERLQIRIQVASRSCHSISWPVASVRLPQQRGCFSQASRAPSPHPRVRQPNSCDALLFTELQQRMETIGLHHPIAAQPRCRVPPRSLTLMM